MRFKSRLIKSEGSKSMNLPQYNADSSLYRSTTPYNSTYGGSFMGNTTATVTPQSCGFLSATLCVAAVGTVGVVCAASCLAGAAAGPGGGIPCYACVVGLLGATYGFCKDCLPAWIRAAIGNSDGGSTGGGGVPECCPQGLKCSCGGKCQTVNGQLRCVGGTCLTPKQSCP